MCDDTSCFSVLGACVCPPFAGSPSWDTDLLFLTILPFFPQFLVGVFPSKLRIKYKLIYAVEIVKP